jgi:hypothetical protein
LDNIFPQQQRERDNLHLVSEGVFSKEEQNYNLCQEWDKSKYTLKDALSLHSS